MTVRLAGVKAPVPVVVLQFASMIRSRLGKALLISAAGAALVVIVRAVRGEPAPAFELPGGGGGAWPTLRPEATPDWVGPVAAPPDAAPLAAPPDAAPTAGEPPDAGEPSAGEPSDDVPFVELRFAEAPFDDEAQGAPWIEASAGPPPATHLVKAKLGSGIYHLPGMMNYDRTRPDRYYRTAAEAEADGLRAAKR